MKIITVILTLLFSSSLFAEWILLESNTSGYDYYYENKLIYKEGKYIYYWQLSNYPKRDEHGDFSAVFFNQLDCQTRKYKWLYLKFYDQQMSNGNINAEFASDEWDENPDNSVGALIDEYICKNYFK